MLSCKETKGNCARVKLLHVIQAGVVKTEGTGTMKNID